MQLARKIFWGKQSRWQLAVAIGGFWIGLFITLLSLQFFLDVRAMVADKEAEKSYLIINKTVGLANMFDKSLSQFTPQQIDSLAAQPFVKDVGSFYTNTFNIYADVSDQMGLAFDLYMESVPNRFLDTIPSSFKWDTTSQNIPILIGSDFLRIYNFSLAMSQRYMPQLSQSTIQMIPIDIKISGNGRSRMVTAKVVGFSDRIPSVLVPENFLTWANETYGKGASPQPSRLIVEVDDPANQQIPQYLEAKGYDTNRDQLRVGNLANTLQVVSTITGGAGALFILLSFSVFLMNFQLIISRAKAEINILLDLGYRPSELAKSLNGQFVVILGGCVLTVLAVVFALVAVVHTVLADAGFPLALMASWWVPLGAVVLMGMLQALIYWGIRASISK